MLHKLQLEMLPSLNLKRQPFGRSDNDDDDGHDRSTVLVMVSGLGAKLVAGKFGLKQQKATSKARLNRLTVYLMMTCCCYFYMLDSSRHASACR